MATYLSVDLDYWGWRRHTSQKNACTRFINKVLDLDVPILLVKDHHHMLDDVNESGCTRIEHVDYHADLADRIQKVRKLTKSPYFGRLLLNCGTWLNFVEWRKKGEVVWRYPFECCASSGKSAYSRGLGGCHSVLDPFKNDVTYWGHTEEKLGLRKLPWDDVAQVGIAISEDYWHDDGETYATVLPKLLGMEKDPEESWLDRLSKRAFRGFKKRIR